MEHTHALPGAWTLIKDSWHLYIKKWNESIQTTKPLIYLGLAYFVAALLTGLHAAFFLLYLIIGLLGWVLVYWVGLRTIANMLRLSRDETALSALPTNEESNKAWELFFSCLWIDLLVGLMILAALVVPGVYLVLLFAFKVFHVTNHLNLGIYMIGGFLLSVPMFYLALSLAFSKILRIDTHVTGLKALKASRKLIQHRWWKVFGRQLAGSLIFGMLVMVIMMMVIAVLLLAAFALKRTGHISDFIIFLQNPGLIVSGLQSFLQMVMVALFMPLTVGFHAKMYEALRHTKV